MSLFPWTLILAGSLAFAAATAQAGNAAPPARAGACGQQEYSYAAVFSVKYAYGVEATIAPIGEPTVISGHVAGWIGMVSADSEQWLQVGFNAVPGSGNKLYYEISRARGAARYVALGRNIAPGEQHRLAVVEPRPNWWQVLVDGTPASNPILVPGSNRSWAPMAAGESWNGGRTVCNQYAYSFAGVAAAAAPSGSWQAVPSPLYLEDPGYRVNRTGSSTSFSVGPTVNTARTLRIRRRD